MSLMFAPLRKYADFQGRARRSEYWLFLLFCFISMAAFGRLGALLSGGDPNSPAHFLVFLLLSALIIPHLAVLVRRLHDTDRTGWWVLIAFIPFGGIVTFIFNLMDGTPGPNRFGPDPKERDTSRTVAV